MAEATRKSRWNLRRIGLYALAVVIVVCVALFLIGRHQLNKAAQIKRETEVKLAQAIRHIAGETMDRASAAQDQAAKSNWHDARTEMGKALDGVRVMEQVAPPQMRSEIEDVERKATEAQQAVAEGSEESVRIITDLLQSLQGIRDRTFVR